MNIKSLFKNKKNPKYSGQKALNRRYLIRQNLIFFLVVIIIITGLVIAVIRSLSFLVVEIDRSLRLNSNQITKPEFFDMSGFEKIKGEITIMESSVDEGM